MSLSARPSPIAIPVQNYCALGWTLVIRRGAGVLQKEGALPLASSSLAHRPVFNPGLGPACPPPIPQHVPPSRKQMRKALGVGGASLSGCSCWAPVPACFFLLPMPTGASRNGVTVAWLPGCLAQGPAVGLLPSETPHPFPGMLVWATGRSLTRDHGQLLVPPEMGLLTRKL